MLFKRGSTISAAEGGCQAEVGGKANHLRALLRLSDQGPDSRLLNGRCWFRGMHGSFSGNGAPSESDTEFPTLASFPTPPARQLRSGLNTTLD